MPPITNSPPASRNPIEQPGSAGRVRTLGFGSVARDAAAPRRRANARNVPACSTSVGTPSIVFGSTDRTDALGYFVLTKNFTASTPVGLPSTIFSATPTPTMLESRRGAAARTARAWAPAWRVPSAATAVSGAVRNRCDHSSFASRTSRVEYAAAAVSFVAIPRTIALPSSPCERLAQAGVDLFRGPVAREDPAVAIEDEDFRRALDAVRPGDGAVEPFAVRQHGIRHALVLDRAVGALQIEVDADPENDRLVRVFGLELFE